MLSSLMLVLLEREVTFRYLRDLKSLAELMRCGVYPTDSIRRFSKSAISHMTPRFSMGKESAHSHKFITVSFKVTQGWRDAAHRH